MFFINNGMNYLGNWEVAYHTLFNQYQQLQHDYHQAVERTQSLRIKIDCISKENEEIKAQINKQRFQNNSKQPRSTASQLTSLQNQITSKTGSKDKISKSKIRTKRSFQTADGVSYECTYEGCTRVYSSPVSMNLHIKMKHNGGTKKERQAYAKMVLDAQERGDQPPAMDINLPPNFIEVHVQEMQEFRTSYEYMKKYSM